MFFFFKPFEKGFFWLNLVLYFGELQISLKNSQIGSHLLKLEPSVTQFWSSMLYHKGVPDQLSYILPNWMTKSSQMWFKQHVNHKVFNLVRYGTNFILCEPYLVLCEFGSIRKALLIIFVKGTFVSEIVFCSWPEVWGSYKYGWTLLKLSTKSSNIFPV